MDEGNAYRRRAKQGHPGLRAPGVWRRLARGALPSTPSSRPSLPCLRTRQDGSKMSRQARWQPLPTPLSCSQESVNMLCYMAKAVKTEGRTRAAVS